MPRKMKFWKIFYYQIVLFDALAIKEMTQIAEKQTKQAKEMEIGEIEKVGKKVTQIMDHIGRLIHTGLEMIDHF